MTHEDIVQESKKYWQQMEAHAGKASSSLVRPRVGAGGGVRPIPLLEHNFRFARKCKNSTKIFLKKEFTYTFSDFPDVNILLHSTLTLSCVCVCVFAYTHVYIRDMHTFF